MSLINGEKSGMITFNKSIGINVTKMKLINPNYMVLLSDNQSHSTVIFNGFVLLYSVAHLKNEFEYKLEKMELPMDVDIYRSYKKVVH